MLSRVCLKFAIAASTLLVVLAACAPSAADKILEDGRVRMEMTDTGGMMVTFKGDDGLVQLSTGANSAFALISNDGDTVELLPGSVQSYQASAESEFGSGAGLLVELQPVGSSPFSELKVQANICLADKEPGVLICHTDIEGVSDQTLAALDAVSFYRMDVRADLADPQAEPFDFYLFQGAGYNEGNWFSRIKVTGDYSASNWTVPHLPEQKNGGGYPLNYLWSAKAGLAIAQIDTMHQVLALPVRTDADGAVSLAMERPSKFLRPDENGISHGVPVMIGAFSGDFYGPVRTYGSLIQRGSFRFPEVPEDAYESIWCGWGFGREFAPRDIYQTLPEIRKLDIPWVVIDDGFQNSIGSWPLIEEKFPRGDEDMRALVDSIHAAGFKAKLWWVPMNVQSNDPMLAEHPDWVVLDENGLERRNTWWDVSQLCPAVPEVIEQQKALVRRFLIDWDYDGFKMDGGCLGMTPPCHNPAHNHKHPEESCRAVATLFKAMMDEAERIKPGAVLEVCECGLPHDPFKMRYYNQQVSADPLCSDQVRARIKTYRALLGDKAALYGDHVELSTEPLSEGKRAREVGKDFASTLALGGVIGSKFTAMADSPSEEQRVKHVAISAHWRHWFNLYGKLKLYEGTYLNLYDIGWDLPETHVVAKGDALYYGVFAQGFSGKVELRGLEHGKNYVLTNYDTGEELGHIKANGYDELECSVKGELLIAATPAK